MRLGGNHRWVPLITVELNLAVIALKRPKILKFISTIADNTTKDYRKNWNPSGVTRTRIRIIGVIFFEFFLSRERKLSSRWGKFELSKFNWIYRQRRFQNNVTFNLASSPGKNDSQSEIWSMKQNNHPASRGLSIFLDKSRRGNARPLAEVPRRIEGPLLAGYKIAHYQLKKMEVLLPYGPMHFILPGPIKLF